MNRTTFFSTILTRVGYASCGASALTIVLGLLGNASLADSHADVTEDVSASLAHIAATDASYQAIIALDPAALSIATTLDRQRKAHGPLHGEIVLLKDNIESIGLPTTAGSLALAENDTGKDAPLVAQLRQAGAVILGKTNLSEWANFRSEHSMSGWSGVGGQTRNAHDRSRSPCGSSSGSAVAVALGYARVTIGTETSGSIVCPAAVNGVVGFKPTLGLVSGDGIVPLASSQDTAGPIASSVELAAATLAVISDPQRAQSAVVSAGLRDLASGAGLAGLRVGVFASTQGFDVRRDAQLQSVLDTLEANGAVLVPGLRLKPYHDFSKESYDVLLYEFRRDLNRYLSGLPAPLQTLDLDSLIAFNNANREQEQPFFDQSIFLKAASIQDTELLYLQKHRRTRRAMREEGLDKLYKEHRLDVLVGITVGPAWTIDNVNGDASSGPGMARAAAIAGNPHITLPLGQIEGLPLGISLIGRRWEDHTLAAVALELERLHPAPTYRDAVSD
ncbi:MAG: amidase family protein [Congregibacter sp.]